MVANRPDLTAERFLAAQTVGRAANRFGFVNYFLQ
jgi:hypothetical protein